MGDGPSWKKTRNTVKMVPSAAWTQRASRSREMFVDEPQREGTMDAKVSPRSN